ncbi:MAG TPA: Minf_1886 family protein [Tepidisphaeraceae bacterium]|nr:Minf_1886 family protein [Tepidisphaeraceae bacterium]
MPPTEPVGPEKTLEEIVEEVGLYPKDAFEFIQQGLGYTVNKLHGQVKDPHVSRHVSGRDLSEGLREFALMRWGLMARTVLHRWNVRRTIDFGRIVFALVDSGWMQKTDDDTLEDFRDVYDFKTAFDAGYRIESKA